MRPIHSDFSAAFSPRSTFLVSGRRKIAEVRRIGELSVGEEGLFVFGAGVSRPVSPFARQLPHGVHPIELSILSDGESADVACARMRFSIDPALRWEFALRDGEHPEAVSEGQFFGFEVAAGEIVVYADSLGAAELMREEGVADLPAPDLARDPDAFVRWLERPPAARPGLDALERAIDRASSRDVRHVSASFPRGGRAVGFQLSDSGYFGSYCGISATGKVVEVVTDFNGLLENDWDEVSLAVRDLPIGPLPLPRRFMQFTNVSLVERGEFLVFRATGLRDALDLRGDELREKRATSGTTDFLFDRNATTVRVVAHFGLKPVPRVR